MNLNLENFTNPGIYIHHLLEGVILKLGNDQEQRLPYLCTEMATPWTTLMQL